MPLLILAVVIAVPIVELYVIIQVGHAIGVLWTLLALVATSVIGVRLVRAQGRVVLRDFAQAIASGRPPARAALDGALVFVGGALLIVPGFVTDVVGALLLAPPTRALARRLIVRHYAGRLVAYLAAAGGDRRGAATRVDDVDGRAAGGDRRGAATRVYDVDGRAVELDPDKLPR